MDRETVAKKLTLLSKLVDELGYEVLGEEYTPPSKRSKRKRATDPNAPKKPVSAYFHFCAYRRQSASPGEDVSAKALGACWKTLTEVEKRPFEQQAAADKARYDDAVRAAA